MVGDTRAFLESVAHAVTRMAVLRAEIAEIADGGDPRSGPRVHRPGLSDPTASSALRRMDAVEDKAKQLADCEGLIGEGLVLCANVRAGLKDIYGEVLERFYVDCQSWEEVAEDLLVSARTCIRYRDAALEWCDGVGLERVKSEGFN